MTTSKDSAGRWVFSWRTREEGNRETKKDDGYPWERERVCEGNKKKEGEGEGDEGRWMISERK
jgi:hypothetical protein